MNQSVFVAMPEQQVSPSPDSDYQVQPAGLNGPELERMTRSILAVEAATYHWNIETDEIVWHGDTDKVFSHVDPQKFANGRAYASLLDPDNFTSRFETVMRNNHNDGGEGVPFSIEYSIKPFGRDQEHSIWIEDHGRWFAGPDGHPKEVYGVVRQIDDRHRQDQHLQFLGNCDPLTGMMNRGRLTEALGETIELARSEDHSSAFLIVAVSNLAIVNDAYGFDVADDVITKIGRRLREVVRTGDVIGRYSGSKFGIIMSRATREEVSVAADRFLTIARQRVIETEMGPVWAMLSIGGVILPNNDEDSNLTMAHAEEALTDAFRLPTDAVVIYQPSANLVSERKLNSRCAVEIVHSLKENNFTLAYQPVVDAQTKEVRFHEALLRMKCDNGDIVAAGHLIPIAEKLGLVRLIDQLVVLKVMSALRQFPEANIALNISGVTANDPRWFDKLAGILEENVDITDRLTVEITETVALEDIDQTVSFIERLHVLGCKVAIDDFGAGFTSFQNLKVLNVDKVKIDGSFCENLSNNKDNQFFVHTLIELSKKFDLEVVAEWVETEEDAKLLTSWGVDYLQGQLYGMAESQSPWGEPIVEAEEICVVPSEILVRDGDEVENHIDDGNGTESAPDEESQCPFATPAPFDGSLAGNAEFHDHDLAENPELIELNPADEPFQAIVTNENPLPEIPDLPIETDGQVIPTARLEPTGPVATAVTSPEENQAGTCEISPLDLELKKLRDAIQLLNA